MIPQDAWDRAYQIVRMARLFRMWATAGWLVEVPEFPFSWWAIGETKVEALTRLAERIALDLHHGRRPV